MTQLVVIRNPFDCRERDTFAIEGQRPVAALVGEYIPAGATEGVELVAVINGAVVPREEWETRCLSPGEQLIVLPVIGKGGGGLLGSLASLALMVVAPAIGLLIGTLHRGSRQSAGSIGEILFLFVLGVVVFWLYYRIYNLGPESVLPAEWHNPPATPGKN